MRFTEIDCLVDDEGDLHYYIFHLDPENLTEGWIPLEEALKYPKEIEEFHEALWKELKIIEKTNNDKYLEWLDYQLSIIESVL